MRWYKYQQDCTHHGIVSRILAHLLYTPWNSLSYLSALTILLAQTHVLTICARGIARFDNDGCVSAAQRRSVQDDSPVVALYQSAGGAVGRTRVRRQALR
eukprot:SAG31_NODE_21632_length_544_cov_9.775281_2_plen_99_part_01